MSSLRNVLKDQGFTSQVLALQYRYFRTFAYLSSAFDKKSINARQKFKLKQAKMQYDDGIPVFLKGGTRDKILFNLTLGVLIIEAICVVQTLRELYQRS